MGEGGKGGSGGNGGTCDVCSCVVSKLCGCDVGKGRLGKSLPIPAAWGDNRSGTKTSAPGTTHCVGAEGAAPGREAVDGRLRASLSVMSCSVSSEGCEMVIMAE